MFVGSAADQISTRYLYLLPAGTEDVCRQRCRRDHTRSVLATYTYYLPVLKTFVGSAADQITPDQY